MLVVDVLVKLAFKNKFVILRSVLRVNIESANTYIFVMYPVASVPHVMFSEVPFNCKEPPV